MFRLLRCLAHAVVKHGGKFLLKLVPGGEALYDIAHESYQEYRREQNQDALRSEIAALAIASKEQIQDEVRAAVAIEAKDQPEEVQVQLVSYLSQVPASIRRSLRRPSDPTGTTVPGTLPLNSGEDLLPLLPAQPPRFQAGQRPLPGLDWELVEMLGIGGFGEVWRARHASMRSKKPVALKFCLDPTSASILRNEAGVLDQLQAHGSHPGIVTLQEVYLKNDPPCLQYDYVEGGDLAGLLQEWLRTGEHSFERVNALFLQLVDIVAHAHSAQPAIVHCDLKPANILMQRTSEGRLQLRVTDFGIGGLAAQQVLEQARGRVGSRQELLTEAVRGAYTPLYASPEQKRRRRGERPDPRDDIHALGVIWYQLLSGDLSIESMPMDWRDVLVERGVPGEQLDLLAKCLTYRAEKRVPDAVALGAALRTVLGGRKEEAVPKKDALTAAGEKPTRNVAAPPAALAVVEDRHPGGVSETAPWAGYWFVNVGEAPHRNWDDCVKYGFLAAGYGRIYSESLRKLKPGSKVFAYLKERGYVGYGEVIQEVQPAKDFTPVGQTQPLFDLPLSAETMTHDRDNLDLCEWVVGIRWIKTFPRHQAKRFSGAFANPNIVCKLRDQRTVEFLRREFGLTDDHRAESDQQTEPAPLIAPLDIKFVLVPAGKFWMGGGGGKAGDRQVEIKDPFYMGVYPVTQREWEAVMKGNPSHFHSSNGGGPDHPVEKVSWDDVQQFLKELNANYNADGLVYRLPTEAEWEYACRGAASSKEDCAYHFYLDQPSNSLSSTQANCDGLHPDGKAAKGPYLQRTSKVGSYPANKLGLYDMHGNVYEWTADFHVSSSTRVVRGGSCFKYGSYCRAGFRYGAPLSARHCDLGFRLVAVQSGSK